MDLPLMDSLKKMNISGTQSIKFQIGTELNYPESIQLEDKLMKTLPSKLLLTTKLITVQKTVLI